MVGIDVNATTNTFSDEPIEGRMDDDVIVTKNERKGACTSSDRHTVLGDV